MRVEMIQLDVRNVIRRRCRTPVLVLLFAVLRYPPRSRLAFLHVATEQRTLSYKSISLAKLSQLYMSYIGVLEIPDQSHQKGQWHRRKWTQMFIHFLCTVASIAMTEIISAGFLV